MSHAELERTWGLRLRLLRSTVAVTLPTLAVVGLYGFGLLRLTSEEVRSMLQLGLGLAVVLTPLVVWQDQYISGPIWRCLEQRSSGTADRDSLRAGFAAACNAPLRVFALGCLWWILGGLVFAIGMRIRHAGFPLSSSVVMAAAASAGGFATSVLQFYTVKRILAPLRETLAAELPDPEERRRLIRLVPLRQKLLVAVSGVSLSTLCFALPLAHVRSIDAVESFATRMQHADLERAAAAPAAPSLEQTSAAANPASRWRFILLDEGGQRVVEGMGDALLPGELAAIREQGVEAGDSTRFDSPNAFAWRRIPGHGVLVAVARPTELRRDRISPWMFSGLVVFASVVFALWVGWFAASDVSTVTAALRGEVGRLAGGDLSEIRPMESEDEMGELARRFEGMGAELREVVARVAASSSGVESAAAELASISELLLGVTHDQVRGLDQVTGSMDRIQGEVRGIADSAQDLSRSVDESSGSMLELDVTSEQLNQAAGALSERVSEVSTSIDQMTHSARQVLGSIEELAAASAETSSSMEVMATSMREVDLNATETARLSSNVVEIADSGRKQVEQTIRGMEAIQAATDTARSVIHGLGERAGEIGQILTVIDDVAEETNLLALNAAIIAAQAGDQGRAFSVVADEIKDLADKVMASTKEIGGLIRGVQEEVNNAVGAIEGGAHSVESGVQLSAEAGIALENITTAARESGDRIGEIVAAVKAQSNAAVHVVTLMEKVREGAERIRNAGAEQSRGNEVVLRGASAMSDVAQQVGGATEEQTRGARRMREAIESVRAAVEQIDRSLQEQSDACQRIAELLARVHARTTSNEESADRMREAMRGLLQQAEGLREGVRHFRV